MKPLWQVSLESTAFKNKRQLYSSQMQYVVKIGMYVWSYAAPVHIAFLMCNTVKAVNFAGLIFRVSSTKTYSRVVKFALSRCSLVIVVLHKDHTMITSNWTAQKQSRPHTLSSILIHNSNMSRSQDQVCIQNIANIFVGI